MAQRLAANTSKFLDGFKAMTQRAFTPRHAAHAGGKLDDCLRDTVDGVTTIGFIALTIRLPISRPLSLHTRNLLPRFIEEACLHFSFCFHATIAHGFDRAKNIASRRQRALAADARRENRRYFLFAPRRIDIY